MALLYIEGRRILRRRSLLLVVVVRLELASWVDNWEGGEVCACATVLLPSHGGKGRETQRARTHHAHPVFLSILRAHSTPHKCFPTLRGHTPHARISADVSLHTSRDRSIEGALLLTDGQQLSDPQPHPKET